jgi:hypothetical protein
MFQMHVGNVLCDGATLTATSSSSDTYYGASKVEAFSFPNSNITATAYIARIGDTVAIADVVTPWQYGLFKRHREYIKIK